MSDTANYTINVTGNAATVINKITSASETATSKVASLCGAFTKLGNAAFTVNNVIGSIKQISNIITDTIKPGELLNASLADLSAITGVAGDKLNEIEDAAIEASKAFGGSAADNVESYKILLSKLGPEIAQTPSALKAMGENVNILSKTMGDDATAAAGVLTTAMNQFGISLDNPTVAAKKMKDMMNVMSAAAKVGSAELPQISEALENSGMAAKTSGVQFEELNAAIQILDKAGKKGAEGGMAIRNALSIMSQGRFMESKTKTALEAAGISVEQLGDKSKTLSERLRLLQPVMNDSALISQLFGRENMNAGLALINGVDQMDEYTKAITGTNSAQEQSNIVMQSYEQKMNRLKSHIDALKIKLFDVANWMMNHKKTVLGLAIGLGVLAVAIEWTTIVTKAKAAWDSIVVFTTGLWTAKQWLLNSAFWACPLTWIIAGIIALIAAITYVIYKTEGWGETWSNLMRYMNLTWDIFKGNFEVIWLNVQDTFLTGVEYIQKAWYKLKSLWDEDSANSELAKINDEQNKRAEEIAKAKGKLDELKKERANIDVWQVKWNDKSLTDITGGLKDKLGISEPTIPGATKTDTDTSTTNTGKLTDGVSENITSGGTRNTSIEITFKNMVESIIYNGGADENKSDFEKQVTESLLRVLSMAYSVA